MAIVIRSLQIISKQLAYLTIVIAVLLTLAIASLYWLSDAVEQRKDEIATWVSDYIGYPVSLQSAGVNWLGLEPKLQVAEITILQRDASEELLTLESLYLGVDLIDSIRQGQPVINDIALSGLTISVIRDQNGNFVVQGMQSDQQSQADQAWLAWLDSIDDIRLENLMLSYSDFNQPTLSGHYGLKQAQFEHDDSQWQASINLMLPETMGDSVQLIADIELDQNYKLISWQAESKLNNIDISSLSDWLHWRDISLTKGRIDANTSAKGSTQYIASLTTEFSVNKLQLASTTQAKKQAQIDSASGIIDWSNSNDSFRLSGRQLDIAMNGQHWLPTEFILSKDPDNLYTLNADYLRLSDVTALAVISEHTPEIIRQQQPAGDIEQLAVQYSLEQGLYALSLDINEAGVLPWQGYPGVAGFSAAVKWSNGFGSLQLASEDVSIYPETWLDEALYFDSISGLVRLSQQGDKWTFDNQALRVSNNELIAQLDGSIEYNKAGKLRNDLVITLDDFDISTWKSYVPQHALAEDFKAWSNNAFVAGKVRHGTIELVGDMEGFPYDKRSDEGRFIMDLDVENVQLHYAPVWPDIVDVTGKVTSQGSTLLIKSQQGKIAGFDFIDVTTRIDRFVLSKPVLYVDGTMQGKTQQALSFLNNSPLKQRFGVISDIVTAEGASDIGLSLKVPLTQVDDTDVTGHVSFKDSVFQSSDYTSARIEQVNGKLRFNNNGVEADTITANFMGEALDVEVKPDQDKTKVLGRGKTSVEKLNLAFNNTIPNFITGDFNYELDVFVGEKTIGEFFVDVVFNSDLVGVNIDLPAPFDKQPEQGKPLRAAIEHVGDDLVYTLNYEQQLSAILMPAEQDWRGQIKLGEGQVSLPEHGVKLGGNLASINADEWLAWQSRYPSNQQSSFLDTVDDISVSVQDFSGFNQTLSQLTISMQRDAQGWRSQFRSEQTKADVYFPLDFDGVTPLEINIDKVFVTLPDTKSKMDEDAKPSAMALWPAMKVNIDDLNINKMKLGKLTLNSSRSQDSWKIDQASLISPVLTLDVTKGIWRKQADNDSTQFAIQAKSSDLAGLLQSLDYVQAIDATGVEVNWDFNWPDNPLAVSNKILKGDLSLKVGSGKLTDVKPGAAGRIFGLLSFAAIPRRLSLDFSDLFGKGLNFSSISGSFKFANGVATTQDLALNAESALIEVKGPVDLTNQTYQQQVTVTPNVSSSLPLAGAVAGGPIGLGVGTAILLVDKLAGNLFDKNIVNLISYKYDLTGPWQDPQLTVVKPAKQ